MDKIAFLFSGQGSQYSGMGKSLCEASPAAAAVFALADSIRPGTSSQCFEGTAEELAVTINTQPCLYCVDLAGAEALREAGVFPDAVAGFSLGEVAALTFSGAFSPKDGFSLVMKRAALMNAASEASQSGMVALLKLTPEKAAEVCREVWDSYPVNFNRPGQTVAATLRAKKEALAAAAKAAGGRGIPLAVSGGFHSPFMQSAADGLREVLQSLPMSAPAIPVYANATASPYEGADREMPARQLVSPVYWQKTLERLWADGFTAFVEVGAGKTLSGFVKKTLPEAFIANVEDAQSLQKTIEAIKGA